jgi:hypothetical protein
LRLRAKLTQGVTLSKHVLAGRRIVFTVGKTTYQAYTNRRGIAQVAPSPPIAPGAHRIGVRFRGNAKNLGSGLHVELRVTNSPGSVVSQGVLRLPGGRTVRISATSDGSAARGNLLLHAPGLRRSIAIGAIGMRGDAATAWLGGVDPKGRRYLVHLQRVPGTKLRIEIAGAASVRGTVGAAQVKLTRR